MSELSNLETLVEVLERQIATLRRQVREHEEYIDTVTSPLYKRIHWWFQGFYFRKVGRWYGN
jgi:chaperonin cofactor prefoldin